MKNAEDVMEPAARELTDDTDQHQGSDYSVWRTFDSPDARGARVLKRKRGMTTKNARTVTVSIALLSALASCNGNSTPGDDTLAAEASYTRAALKASQDPPSDSAGSASAEASEGAQPEAAVTQSARATGPNGPFGLPGQNCEGACLHFCQHSSGMPINSNCVSECMVSCSEPSWGPIVARWRDEASRDQARAFEDAGQRSSGSAREPEELLATAKAGDSREKHGIDFWQFILGREAIVIAGVDASGARRFSAAYREYAETADHRFVEISAFLPAPGRGLLALDKTRVDGRLLDTSIPPATSALARAALEDLGNLRPERMSGVSFSMSGCDIATAAILPSCMTGFWGCVTAIGTAAATCDAEGGDGPFVKYTKDLCKRTGKYCIY